METMVSRNSRSASCEVESSEIIALRETGSDSDADSWLDCMPAEHPVFALELHGVTVRRGGQQIGYRPLMGSSKFGVRIQRRPGSQHKCALPSTRMGNARSGSALVMPSKSIMSKSNGLESQ